MSNLKEKWLKALRSGEYKQAPDFLNTADGFCCLGVLCDIKDPEAWGSNSAFLQPGKPWTDGEEESSTSIPVSLSNEVGLNSNQCSMLMGLNDSGKFSFAEIADVIESNTIEKAHMDSRFDV